MPPTLRAVPLALLWAAAIQAAAPPPGEAWLDRLVMELGAEAFEEREAASRELEAVGSAAVPALMRGLESKDVEVRGRAMELAKRAERRAAAFFGKLGAKVQWHGGKADIVSYSQGDASKLRDEHLCELIGFPWPRRLFFGNASIGDAGMTHIGRLTELDYLELGGTRVTDIGLARLAGLTKLKKLGLSDTEVRGPGLVHLKRMKQLESLSPGGGKLDDAGLQAGISGLKDLDNLRALWFRGTRLTDDGLVFLKQIQHPIGLDLSGTAVTDSGIAHLRAIPKLIWVELSATTVTDRGCAQLAEIKTLEKIWLNRTRVTAIGLLKFQNMPRLRQLSFDGVSLGAKDLRDLRDFKPKDVHLSGTSFRRDRYGSTEP